MTPEVSVIIPTYNRSFYLRQAVESVLNQTFSDFEVIVVDDGSTDDTEAVMQEFSDSRIHYFHQSNRGRSVARNNGFNHAQGEYIAFLDDDDLFLPEKLRTQIALLEQRPALGFVASGFQYVDNDRSVIETTRPWLRYPELDLRTFLHECAPLHLSASLFRQQTLRELHYCFDSSLDPFEDTDFFLRIFLGGNKFDWVPGIVSSYRMHENGTFSQMNGLQYNTRVKRFLGKFFRYKKVPESLLCEKREVYAYYDLLSACRSYAFKQVDPAQVFLRQALEVNPGWGQDLFPEMVTRFAGFAASDPRSHINFVFDHLPPELSHLEKHRKECFRRFLERVTKAGSYGEGPLKDLARPPSSGVAGGDGSSR